MVTDNTRGGKNGEKNNLVCKQTYVSSFVISDTSEKKTDKGRQWTGEGVDELKNKKAVYLPKREN